MKFRTRIINKKGRGGGGGGGWVGYESAIAPKINGYIDRELSGADQKNFSPSDNLLIPANIGFFQKKIIGIS